jgi:predicted RNA-binding Zn-ribbon protein involved in translation (DUF1610 family)
VKSMAEIAEEIQEKYGPEAREWAVNLAAKYAKDDTHARSIVAFALASASRVAEFRGEDAPAIYACPVCHDQAVVPVHRMIGDRKYEAVYSCQSCPAGLTDEAAFWKEQTGREGWGKFNRFFEKKPIRREEVMARIRELMSGTKGAD